MAAFLSHPIQKTSGDDNSQVPCTLQKQMYESTTGEPSGYSIANTSTMQKHKKKRKKASRKRKNHKMARYVVISSSPTLSYSVVRIGNEDRVMFCINGGNTTIPGSISFEHDSGVYRELNNKKGFDNVQFPFTCSLFTPVSYITNPFNNWPSRLNGFKIEINQPGDWLISFHR